MEFNKPSKNKNKVIPIHRTFLNNSERDYYRKHYENNEKKIVTYLSCLL